MNPLLDRLHLYPFERWRELTQGVLPNPALAPISLGIGEPRRVGILDTLRPHRGQYRATTDLRRT